MNIPISMLADGYKYGHHFQYPKNTRLVYTNWTPRSFKNAHNSIDKILNIGQQLFVIWLHEKFNDTFFKGEKSVVCQEMHEELSLYLNDNYDVTHFEQLHDLGYLPIHIKAIEEGVFLPVRIPTLTSHNTHKDFGWLPNFLETIKSNMMWQMPTSATIAFQFKKILMKYAKETDKDNIGFVDYQGHDFSMRGMGGDTSVVLSGLGHASVFSGSDSLPAIWGARKYYLTPKGEFVLGSVNATEHSVMCAGTKGDEIGTFRRLMNESHPKGILSIVSDTWDLWKVCTEYLPILKEEILARDGKIVIRPDSGNPADILCGTFDSSKFTQIEDEDEYETIEEAVEDIKNHITDISEYDDSETHFLKFKNKYYEVEFSAGDCIEARWDGNIYKTDVESITELNIGNKPSDLGVVELLWNVFGGKINDQGYKVLDPHIGAIYGDSITLDRCEEICRRLKEKGFASTNVVLGIGSFTYQYNTRDTFGFAMKATFVEIETEPYDGMTGRVIQQEDGNHYYVESREIFKDPITDDGTKN